MTPATEHSEFAVTLYRPGTQMRWEGQDLDAITVHEDDVSTKEKEGWMTVKNILKEPARKAAEAEKVKAAKDKKTVATGADLA